MRTAFATGGARKLPFAVPEIRFPRSRSANFDRGRDLIARCIRHRRRSQTVTSCLSAPF